ncbi:hypothetical protein [Xanthomonas nasturtii]|uniref:hypothetical protein n=1 Tax=Xanthomonas nasturtii TaxID=1843581 RepID=UPI002013255B|nr:hypothetical protein [Xanthomonas nasturtii]MCL1528026.1 hypothetical protein [Xanthomonas nasturtii]MCL1535501.1 hypothetical protein [Xanthomonas nasturtii]MCL1544838.1 hypothetical protein [Xanthomonas nasturtii]
MRWHGRTLPGAEHAAPDRQLDRAIFDGCMARKGMAPPPHAGDARPMGAHADGHAFDRPDAPEQPPPPHDREFDAAVQACATAQRIAVPLADDWPPGPPPEALAQCLDDAGFAPPPHHG